MSVVWAVLSVIGLIVLGAVFVFVLDVINLGVDKLVRLVRPQRTYQHYPGGPYLQTSTVNPYS